MLKSVHCTRETWERAYRLIVSAIVKVDTIVYFTQPISSVNTSVAGIAPAIISLRSILGLDVVRLDSSNLCVVRVAHHARTQVRLLQRQIGEHRIQRCKAYITIAIRLRYDYDTSHTTKTCSFFARVESRRMEAGARDTS